MKSSEVTSAPATPAPSPAAGFRWRRLVPLVTVMPAIALILSGVITWINLGGVDDFFSRWMLAFATALPVMPLGLLTLVVLDRVLGPRLSAWPRVLATVVLALCTALLMELLMATAVTLSNQGLSAAFPAQWATAYWRSLPAGVVIGLVMGFLIKPRLNRWMAAA
ncbi:DUF2798 domain-containing protein [Hydrogenophaga sp. A37]|uniref:DUF2798 domain-containing protein n=1 Tax=Hydrogenophaga sp. A37 TaxID=1945864 RepID=UPI0009874D38|nr:DUF2798 domain-containing protein [Hydrogenophaga sp. A37]OOG89498.1 hypothetical protein B0E41_00320 [Hydrogenophaga sp. A37]